MTTMRSSGSPVAVLVYVRDGSLYFALMAPSTPPDSQLARRRRPSRGDVLLALGILAAYVVATALAIHWRHLALDRMMIIAEQALSGHLDSNAVKGTVDSVEIGGRYYLALGPLQLLAYIPFAAVPDLQLVGNYVAGLLFGIPAAWLALPLARAYGAKGRTGYWIAAFTAFGSLLFWASVFGNPYYLAQAESFLALTLFLIEWAGRRRPALLGACLGVSFLARPTTILAAIPFGIYLLWTRRSSLRATALSALAFGLPMVGAIAFYGWFNWVRFGSALESGYSISLLKVPYLQQLRDQGLFSLAHIAGNVQVALWQPPDRLGQFPFLSPGPWGMSMLLVSPALLTSLWAGLRDRTAGLLWIATVLVAAPVFLYYGGGLVQYGFRYSLDFTPFLVALMAIGSRRWIGWPERLLVLVSIGSVFVGICWYGTS
jgi:hypothetical protein